MRGSFFSMATVPERQHIASKATAAISVMRKLRGKYFIVQSSLVHRTLPPSADHARSNHIPFTGDQPHVGFYKEREELVDMLLDKDSRRVVVGVNGMGGVGKTMLVSKAYQQVRSLFECSAWIDISKSYISVKYIRRNILCQTKHGNDVAEDDRHDFALPKVNHLRNKKYLIVLDGVWDINVWCALKAILPNNDQGSRIIATTRLEKVVFYSYLGEPQRCFKLKPPSDEHAWELFCKEAFYGGHCRVDLKQSAKEIVSKCGGLPIAVVSVANLMVGRDKTASEWKKVENEFWWYLNSEDSCEEVKRALLLSFDRLPYYLKNCFLYFSIFLVDFPIKKNKLVRLWIAEGLVEAEENWTLKEKAEEYLEELVNWNLVEASTISSSYKMHNITRELAMWIADEEKFVVVHDGRIKLKKPLHQARRSSIHKNAELALICQDKVHLHSIMNFDHSPGFTLPLKGIWSASKFLEVLDLEGARIGKCLDGLDELYNLRYLNLRRTVIIDLPSGFCKLQNLMTLDLRETELERLHFGRGYILSSKNNYLITMRHLYVGRCRATSPVLKVLSGIPAPDGVCESENMQNLSFIKADPFFVSNVGKLDQLTKFGITDVREEHGQNLCMSIKKMPALRQLTMAAAPREHLVLESLSDSSNSPPRLPIRKLSLVGRLSGDQLPIWIRPFKILTRLQLVDSELSENLLSVLQQLVHLEEIGLMCNAYLGKKLCFPNESFAKLRKLQPRDLPNLELLLINKGALPGLEEMNINIQSCKVWHCHQDEGQTRP